jgi:hypothetical protein
MKIFSQMIWHIISSPFSLKSNYCVKKNSLSSSQQTTAVVMQNKNEKIELLRKKIK